MRLINRILQRGIEASPHERLASRSCHHVRLKFMAVKVRVALQPSDSSNCSSLEDW